MKTHGYLALAGLLFVGCVLTGCTTKLTFVKAHSLGSPVGTERLPLSVELRLSDECPMGNALDGHDDDPVRTTPGHQHVQIRAIHV